MHFSNKTTTFILKFVTSHMTQNNLQKHSLNYLNRLFYLANVLSLGKSNHELIWLMCPTMHPEANILVVSQSIL
jgi:hypothetical protein